MQTRLQSGVEAVVGTGVGFVTGVAVGQWIIYPLYHIHPTLWTNISMTTAFTAVSMLRSYVTRRFFNWLHHRQ